MVRRSSQVGRFNTRYRRACGRTVPGSDKFGQTSTTFDETRADVGQRGPEIDHRLQPDLARSRPGIGQMWPGISRRRACAPRMVRTCAAHAPRVHCAVCAAHAPRVRRACAERAPRVRRACASHAPRVRHISRRRVRRSTYVSPRPSAPAPAGYSTGWRSSARGLLRAALGHDGAGAFARARRGHAPSPSGRPFFRRSICLTCQGVLATEFQHPLQDERCRWQFRPWLHKRGEQVGAAQHVLLCSTLGLTVFSRNLKTRVMQAHVF